MGVCCHQRLPLTKIQLFQIVTATSLQVGKG